MNIKRIIREEIEGLKDSSQEDWDWGGIEDVEWTKELLFSTLKHTDIKFKITRTIQGLGDEYDHLEYTLFVNDGSCDSYHNELRYPLIVKWDDGSNRESSASLYSNGCVGYSLDSLLERLNNTDTPWVTTF